MGRDLGRRSIHSALSVPPRFFLVIGARTPSAGVAVGALTLCTILVALHGRRVLGDDGAAERPAQRDCRRHDEFGGNLGGLISPALTPWLAARIGWEAALTMTAGWPWWRDCCGWASERNRRTNERMPGRSSFCRAAPSAVPSRLSGYGIESHKRW